MNLGPSPIFGKRAVLSLCFVACLAGDAFGLQRPPHDCRELAKQADVVVIIKVTSVTSEATVGSVDTYSQKAQATVVRAVKGKIEPTFTLYGKQIDSKDPDRLLFIQFGHVNGVREGTFLAFLTKDKERWVGSHPADSFQEIVGGKVLDRGQRVEVEPLLQELRLPASSASDPDERFRKIDPNKHGEFGTPTILYVKTFPTSQRWPEDLAKAVVIRDETVARPSSEHFKRYPANDEIKTLLSTYYVVTRENWLHGHSHVAFSDIGGYLTFPDGRRLTWIFRPGGLMLVIYPDGGAVHLSACCPRK